MMGRTNVSGRNKINKIESGTHKATSLQPSHPFAGTLAQKATKFTLPWVRDDQKKPSGGRGSSINIEELAKPLEQGERPFANRTNFKYQKAPVVIPFISLKNFKKTNENLVAPPPEPEKNKLRKQQSDLISHLTNSNAQNADNSNSPPQNRQDDDDVSDLLDELETVKMKYQEGLKKKIENEAIANAKRSHEQKLARAELRNSRDYRDFDRGGDGEFDEEFADFERRIGVGDFTMFFDDSYGKVIQKVTGEANHVITYTEEEVREMQEEFDENFLPELREMHKEELYQLHLALKDVVKEKESLDRRTLKYKKLRNKVKENRKKWREEEISHSLADINENGFVSAEALKKDVRKIISDRFGEEICDFNPDLVPFYDEMVRGLSLSPTTSLRTKVNSLVYAVVQFYAFSIINPDYNNAEELKRDAQKQQERVEEFLKRAPILRDVTHNYEKTGHLEFPSDNNERTTFTTGKKKGKKSYSAF